MANYYYLRVSTQTRKATKEETELEFKQNFDRQIGIFEDAGHKLTKYNQFFDRDSGGKRADDREGFANMLNHLKPNDNVYFTETSRFARNYIDGMEVLDILTKEKKVNVHFISSNFILEAGKRYNPAMWYVLSQLLLADEYQKRVISDNTVKGLAKKKKEGVILGAPRTIPEEKIDFIKENMFKHTVRDLSKLTGVSTATISKIRNGLY